MLVGDARLPEDLARAGIDRAACLIAVTDDDLVNISACLQAKAANPGIRTVARIFDETVGRPRRRRPRHRRRRERVEGGGVGLRRRRPRRPGARAGSQLDGLELVAFRHDFGAALPDDATTSAWRADGVHVVAVDGTTAIVCGPASSPVVAGLLSG